MKQVVKVAIGSVMFLLAANVWAQNSNAVLSAKAVKAAINNGQEIAVQYTSGNLDVAFKTKHMPEALKKYPQFREPKALQKEINRRETLFQTNMSRVNHFDLIADPTSSDPKARALAIDVPVVGAKNNSLTTAFFIASCDTNECGAGSGKVYVLNGANIEGKYPFSFTNSASHVTLTMQLADTKKFANEVGHVIVTSTATYKKV